jgi:hypothetical protein
MIYSVMHSISWRSLSRYSSLAHYGPLSSFRFVQADKLFTAVSNPKKIINPVPLRRLIRILECEYGWMIFD